jgi:hypothetical protein
MTMTIEQNRHVGQRRTQGVCWCCASPAPVRPCSYWVNGLTKPLCEKCEEEQGPSLNKPQDPLNQLPYLHANGRFEIKGRGIVFTVNIPEQTTAHTQGFRFYRAMGKAVRIYYKPEGGQAETNPYVITAVEAASKNGVPTSEVGLVVRPYKVNANPAEHDQWVMEWFTKGNIEASCVNQPFHEAFWLKFGGARTEKMFGASPVQAAMASLKRLAEQGRLRRRRIGLSGHEAGFPKWVWTYSLS